MSDKPVYTRRPRAYRPKPLVTADNPKEIKNPDEPATEAQLRYLIGLAGKHEIGFPMESFKVMFEAWRESDTLTKGFVSELIEAYKAKPLRPYVEQPPVPVGYYVTENAGEHEYWVVVESKQNPGRTYAKLLVKDPPPPSRKKFDWVYVKGAVNRFRDQKPLTAEEAGKWGRLHGHCIICGRPLTDVESVKAGIGPHCASKMKGATTTR